MTAPAREHWTIRFAVPAGRHSGRYFAAFLKALARRWGIIAEQIIEAPPERNIKTEDKCNKPTK